MVHFKCFILIEDSPVDACDAVITCAVFTGVVDVDVVGDDDADAKLLGKSDLCFIRSAFRGPILSTASFESSSAKVDSVLPSTRLSI